MSFDYYSETCEGSESVKRVANHMIFMEAVPNGDLLGMLKAGLKMQTNLSEGTMLHFVRDIISGASHLAQKGLAHRDLKLANLMLDRQGRIVIIDFGHVKGGSSASTDPSSAAADQGILRPMSGKVECVGTRGYHAPERFINFSGQATVEVGSWVRITTDPAIYERECRASELSWPNLSDGRPRTIKMGAEGCIEDIDFDDMTVRLSDGLKWLPIRALVGFEDYEATYDSELADVFTLGLVVAKMKSSETPFKDHPQDFDSLAQDGLTQNAWHAWQQDVRGCYRANSFQQDPGFSNELKSFLDCLWRRNPQDPNRPRPRFADLEKAMDNDQETLTKFPGLQWLASGCPSSPLDFVRELQTLQPNLSLQHSVVARTLGDYVFSHQRSLGQAGWKVACQDAYHAAKASQNGKLTVEELASSVKPYGPKRGSAVPLAALMVEHTNANDGVTFQEFEQMVKGARPVARPLAQPEISASMRDREELAGCVQSHIKVHA
jgi:serine/threonine protein kinase